MLIYLVRHGETDWNLNYKVQGKIDIPLNENGLNQANMLARFFENKEIDSIYSSNLIRAYETAKIISLKVKKDVFILPELQEINMGVWEGNLWDNIAIEYKDFIIKWENDKENIPIPEGESYGQVQKRVYKTFKSILAKHKENDKIVIVSHGITIKVLIAKLMKISIQSVHNFYLDNASISIVEYNDEFKIKCLNNTFHLKTSNINL